MCVRENRIILAHNVLNWLHHRLARRGAERLDAIYLSALSFEIYAQQFPIYTLTYICDSHLIYMKRCSANIIRFENK